MEKSRPMEMQLPLDEALVDQLRDRGRHRYSRSSGG
jgi:hypothetical protein